MIGISTDYMLLLGLAIVLFAGMYFGKLSKRFKIPNVTGYLLGGMFLGAAFMPAIFKLFGFDFDGVLSDEFISGLKIFADIELGFIAFSVGSEFKMEYFKRVGSMPVVIAFLESLFAVIFITVGLMLFGFPFTFALAMGAIGGATAPAATIMVIRQYQARGDFAQTTLSVVAIDDASELIYFGFSIAIIQSILSGNSSNIGLLILIPFLEIIASIAIGLFFGFLVSLHTKWFTGRGNRTTIVIAFIFLSIALAKIINAQFGLELSSLMMMMAMGAFFTNFSPNVDTVMPLVDRVTPPIVIIFFVLSGADLKLESMSIAGIVILAVYLIFRIAGKISGTWFGAKITNAPEKVKKWLGFGLLPQGGIALGLSYIVMDVFHRANYTFDYMGDLNINGGDIVRIVVIGAVFFSEIFGPILLRYALFKSGEAEVRD